MITEDYVSFETAKLLKEKGFDESLHYVYQPNTKTPIYVTTPKNFNGGENRYSAPTLQMAMKWLREVHKIFIRVIQSHIEYCACEIYYGIVNYYNFRESFASYEEACEAAIKYCLENLI